MTLSPPAPSDAAGLAAAVRQLALRAHRLMSDPAPNPAEVRELSRRLASLRRQLPARSQGSVARWLDNLERKLQAHSLIAIDG